MYSAVGLDFVDFVKSLAMAPMHRRSIAGAKSELAQWGAFYHCVFLCLVFLLGSCFLQTTHMVCLAKKPIS